MSIGTAPRTPVRPPADTHCSNCGAELAKDQEWCLECGGARTLIHRPPDWRLPLAVVGLVVVLALIVFAIVLVNLSGSPGNSSDPPAAAAAPAAHTTHATPNTTAAAASFPGWPPGLPGWTVVLDAAHSQRAAQAAARRIASAGIQVGVLNSTQHPRLAPGFWVVFSGRFPTKSQAAAATTQLVGLGQTRAHPRLIGRQGG